MAAKPSEILRKTKTKDVKDKKKGDEKDSKNPRSNALINFIAKNKKIEN